MKIWNPAKGDACQGDIVLFRIPDEVSIDLSDEITPREGRLVLAEGEATGHHHAIGITKYLAQRAEFRDDGIARALDAQSTLTGRARLYRDTAAVDALVLLGELTTNALAIGFLIVEDGAVEVEHEEHDTIRVPAGRYYVGGQREWLASDERRVAD